MTLRILAISVFFLPCLLAAGQHIVVNSQGERIVMYPDGSWRPAEPGDSLLIKQYLRQTDAVQTTLNQSLPDKEALKSESPEFIARQWSELYAHLVAEEKKVQHEFRKATNVQFKAGEQLRNAEANKKLIESHQLARLQEDYDRKVSQLSEMKQRQKKIRRILGKADTYNQAPAKITSKKITRIRTDYALYQQAYQIAPEPPPTILPKAQVQTLPPPKPSPPVNLAAQAEAGRPGKAKALTSPLPPHRVMTIYRASSPSCVPETVTRDEASGRQRIELKYGVFFSYTDPDLRPYFKEKDLITCKARLSSSGPYTYLTLDFHIASTNSQSNFGGLQEGSLLRLKMLDGEFISLYNLRSDRGRIDPYSGHTIFTGRYALGKSEMKRLRKTGLDKVRVMWVTGFEDYDITDVDFMIRQLDCLISL